MATIQLLFLQQDKPLLQRIFDQDQLIIGRDPACDIQLSDAEISRRHCQIRKDNGGLILEDLSRNGTLLNQKRITALTPIGPEDAIQIGPWTIRLTALQEPSAPETILSQNPAKREPGLGPLLGSSPPMQKVFAKIRAGAEADCPVCILGESGSGKELVARLIHDLSVRRKRPFVALNCGAIPANLIESTLFGHEKGAFTGAVEKSIGLFEQADGGTLFLDEIGEMPAELQTRLLRVLETMMLRRVGGRGEIPVSVRVLVATHQNLQRAVTEGRFRHDLYYRLVIFPIELPPLRERMEDLPLLCNHFLKIFTPKGANKIFSEEALLKLRNYDWPGNVRELKNTIQRTLLLSKGNKIEAEAIEFSPATTTNESPNQANLFEQERKAILEVLRKTKGNQSKAAKLLGIVRTTLATKLKRLAIDPQEWN